MTLSWRSLATTRSFLALGVGLLAFGGLSILRIQLGYALHPAAPIGLVLTALMYLIPGAAVGLLVPQFRLLHGAILGLLTTVVVWFEVPMQLAPLSWTAITQFILVVTLFGVVVSAAASGTAHWLVQRVTSSATRI
jgi:hypothetical protein